MKDEEGRENEFSFYVIAGHSIKVKLNVCIIFKALQYPHLSQEYCAGWRKDQSFDLFHI